MPSPNHPVPTAPALAPAPAAARMLAADLVASGAWRLLPIIFVFFACAVAAVPARPQAMTDFFASLAAGRRVSCSGDGPLPPECGPAVCLRFERKNGVES